MGKVSIIVPAYNCEKYITQCINSLLNQTYTNIEIIIVNDGSTDNTLEVCEILEGKDSRVKLFSIPNSGVSVARNKGIKNSTGDYITFVDSDDWVKHNMIQLAIEQLVENKADISIWSCIRSYPDKEVQVPLLGRENKIYNEDKSYLYLKTINYFYNQSVKEPSVSAGTTWCKLYKRELIINNEIQFNPDLTRAQDTIFSMNAFYKAKRIIYFNEYLYHYRKSNSSITSGSKYIEDTESPFNALLSEFNSFINKLENSEKYKMAVNVRTVLIIMWHLEHKYFHKNNKVSILKRRKEVKELIKKRQYNKALNNVDYLLLPRKERIMAHMLNRNLIITFYLIYLIKGR